MKKRGCTFIRIFIRDIRKSQSDIRKFEDDIRR